MGLKYHDDDNLTWVLFKIECWNDIAKIIANEPCRGDFVLSKEDFKFIDKHWYVYNYFRFVSSKLSDRVDKELVTLKLKDITEDSYVFYMEFRRIGWYSVLKKRVKRNRIVQWIVKKYKNKA